MAQYTDFIGQSSLMSGRRFSLPLVVVIVSFMPFGVGPRFASAEQPLIHERVFDEQIRPVLQKCIGCHGADRAEADLDLTRPQPALDSGAIVPHDANSSTLLERVASQDPETRMPPDGEALKPTDIERLKEWINAGANWPTHWAYRTLAMPDVPVVSAATSTGIRSPIDNFVAARLAKRGLAMSAEADRRTLVRRLYFDLIGMPPTYDQVELFVDDPRPDAYEQLVDQLLASPHYGERWARHWMDLVHFAETHGHDQDRPRDHAWPYRDYLIRRLNEDIAYDRFVQEQLAGDTMFPYDPWALVGTGMLAAGPWDESSLRDIQPDSLDRLIGQYLDRDDMVTTVMSTFASTSVHCARCHNHKFDPISQDDYYGLQAVFAGIDRGNRKYDDDPHVAERRRELLARRDVIQSWSDRREPVVLDEPTQAKILAWEADRRQDASEWRDVEVTHVESEAGSILTLQDDGTILASGDRPEKDVYSVVFRSDVVDLREIRIEVLNDPTLPHTGPGRQDNGNLHLSEVQFSIVSGSPGTETVSLPIVAARSDFDQDGWTIQHAIDGNEGTAWGIYPEVGKPHAAAFQVDVPAAFEKLISDQLLQVQLRQSHGGGHLIGRLRIAVSSRVGGPLTAPWPRHIEQILAQTPDQRSPEDRMTLAAYVLTEEIDDQLASLPDQQLVYCGTNQFEPDGSFQPTATPRAVHVLARGDVTKPLRKAQPAALRCVDGHPWPAFTIDDNNEAARRVALAQWLSSNRNGLVWRSIANRLWQYHFGQGLVDTPNDFGFMGSVPSHPQLLEWLAVRLQQQGGHWKALHREIVCSAAYRQSSADRADAAPADGGNRLVWRMNRRRLDAEQFRDALLMISQSLDARMGGPSDRLFVMSPGVHVTPVVDYRGFDVDDAANHRRTVYRFLFRTVPDPFMEALDCPDASQLAPKRTASVTAIQALATMNDKFVVRQCERLASQIEASTSTVEQRIELAFRLVLLRKPTAEEAQRVARYAAAYGWANMCRVLFNTNEFMFVD